MSALSASMATRLSRSEPRALVIGGSAGSIEVLGMLLPGLLPALSVPVIVVLHLPREQPSLLCDIFASRCQLEVQEGQDKEPLTAGKIYFAPPDYHLLVDAGPRLALSIDPPVNFSRPCIDVLFDSAAQAYGPGLTAILLSGANSDGARGMLAVQAGGGTTIVQAPESSYASAMPEAALALLAPDHVLEPSSMASLINSMHCGSRS